MGEVGVRRGGCVADDRTAVGPARDRGWARWGAAGSWGSLSPPRPSATTAPARSHDQATPPSHDAPITRGPGPITFRSRDATAARPAEPRSREASPASSPPTSGDLRHAPSALPRQEASTTTVRSRSCTGCKDLAWKPPSMPGPVRASRRRHGLASLRTAGLLTSARSDHPWARRPTFAQVRAAIAVAPRAAPAASTGRTEPQGDPYAALSIFGWAALWPPVP